MNTANAHEATEQESFLEEALERFKLAEQAEDLIRSRGLDDLRMRAGDQWDPDIKKRRVEDQRPCLTVNRLPQFVRQVCNDQRQNRPSIQVSPVDDQADIPTSEILQGYIRHIEYDSGADGAYDTAFESAATTGIGYWRVITEYSDPMSFDLDIKIKRIRNPFSVYIDPDAKEVDRSDMRWAFIVEDFTKEEFEARYPDAKVCKGGRVEWELAKQKTPSWMDEAVRVAEYFCITTTRAGIVQLADGRVVTEDKLRKAQEVGLAGTPEWQPVKRRQTDIPAVKWCKLIGTEVLEETVWPGRWIPIVPVLGDELEVDGQVILEGVIRHAKDQQKMLNVFVSTETESIGLVPKAPWLVAEGQIEGREPTWRSANTKTHAYLTYKPTSLNGQPVPAPQRIFGEANVQAVTGARMQAQDDLKSLTGIYDSALGAHSNETSGIAIRARQSQSNTANFHLVDNLTRSIRHCGRILIDLIPKVIDTPRILRVIGEDGEEKQVLVNQHHTDPETGEERVFDFGVGKYDVRVTAGPSFATKRQEAAASMMDLTKSYPPLAQVAGDLIVKNMDWPGAQEISDRLKKLLPPHLQDDKKGSGSVPPEVQAKLKQGEQAAQMVDQLTKALNDAHDQLESKEMELASKERIALLQSQTELIKTWATLDQKDAHAAFQAELAEIQNRLRILGEAQPIEPALPPQAAGPGPLAEPPEAGEAPEQAGLDPATGGGFAPGTPDPGQMPGPTPDGLPAAPAPGSPMENP